MDGKNFVILRVGALSEMVQGVYDFPQMTWFGDTMYMYM
jgi:hypothetical protein